MNKYLLCVSGLLGLIIGSVSQADQVTINISAKVLDKTCTLSPATSNFLVEMVSADLRDVAVDQPIGNTPFEINLTDCSKSTSSVNVKFTGTSSAYSSSLLQIDNTVAGAAKGIAIGIYDTDQNRIMLNTGQKTFQITNFDKMALGFIASYVKTNTSDYSAGKVTAVANFEIAYE